MLGFITFLNVNVYISHPEFTSNMEILSHKPDKVRSPKEMFCKALYASAERLFHIHTHIYNWSLQPHSEV